MEELKNKIVTGEALSQMTTLQKGYIDTKVAKVEGQGAIAVTKGTEPTVSLNIAATQGENVTVDQTNGLKVSVNLSNYATKEELSAIEVPVESVSALDNAIEVNPTEGEVKVGLKLNNATGTAKATYPVKLDKTATGLQATIDLSNFWDKQEMPKDLVVSSGKLSDDGNELQLTLSSGDVVKINVAKLVDMYKPGAGLKENDDDDHTFEVKKAADSEAFLEVTANGVAVKGVQTAINNAVKEVADDVKDIVNALDELAASDVKATYNNAETTVQGALDTVKGAIDTINNTTITNKVDAALGELDLTAVGGAGKYVQVVSQTDGQLAATAQDLNATAVAATKVGDGTATTVQGVLGELYEAISSVSDNLDYMGETEATSMYNSIYNPSNQA